MNRIRKVNDNLFQVLVTPSFISNGSMELLLGSWPISRFLNKDINRLIISDEYLRNYKILEFDTMQDAIDEAYKHPPIDWNKLINIHHDSYATIVQTVTNAIGNNKMIVEIDSHLMNPTELKETIFNRVFRHGDRFNLFYDANDVISVNIINPWTRNLLEISQLLKMRPELRIKKMLQSKTHITLIGLTEVDTAYEIRLWTSQIAQYVRWIKNNNLDPNIYIKILSQIIERQQIIDNGDIIR